ncbi:DUF4430 domain-containing protein [Chloroflexota bacterium]
MSINLEKGSKSYKRLTILATLFVVVGFCGCAVQPSLGEEESALITVVATRDFGREVLFQELVEVRGGSNAMDALKHVAEVETAYGGGFVNAIAGLCSEFSQGQSTARDWFLYVNGILSDTGALDYTLRNGDVEHWDFRSWRFNRFVPAIIGDFPEPFLHGFRGIVYPTFVVYEDGLEDEAESIADKLGEFGVESVATKNISELSQDEKESSNLLILATMDCPLIAELNRIWNRLGFYARFEDGSIQTVNANGEAAATYGTASGLIQATKNPWNPEGIGVCGNAVWMITGTDRAGVKNAVAALTRRHAEFKHAYAAAVTAEGIIRIPQ